MGIVLLLGTVPAKAVDWEKLVMPGPLTRAHADIESDCSNCHRPFEPGAEGDSCIKCHEDVGDDIRDAKGFHGRSRVDANGCRICHPEHQGRDADIVGLDAQTFLHDLTDFPLKGEHASRDCVACHAAQTPHRQAPGDCGACHGDRDPHAGALGGDCGECHSEAGWLEASFDHDRTSFPLSGRHRRVDCGLCHPDQAYEGTHSDCSSCHGLDDVHAGFFGPDCQKCHSSRGWSQIGFRHERDTKFVLLGAHRDLRCRACHAGPVFEVSLGTDCSSCHAREDVHRGRNGSDCSRCHDTSSWANTTFDHDQTDFPLRGRHTSTRCSACHSADPFADELAPTCQSCHRSDDVHAGQLGTTCGSCHREQSWSADLFFEHDITRFPLLGLHAVAGCDQCHVTLRFRDAKTECADCHEDTRHRGALGPDCGRCHNPNGWRLWKFDHSQTGFPMVGAHESVDCQRCHRTDSTPSVSCLSCHVQDDEHDGAFGRDCSRCHTQASWEHVDVTH